MNCDNILDGEHFDPSFERERAKKTKQYEKELATAIEQVADFSNVMISSIQKITQRQYDPLVKKMIDSFEDTGRDSLIAAFQELSQVTKDNFDLESEQSKIIATDYLLTSTPVIAKYLKAQLAEIEGNKDLHIEDKVNYLSSIKEFSEALKASLSFVRNEFNPYLEPDHPFLQGMNSSLGSVEGLLNSYKKIRNENIAAFYYSIIPTSNYKLKEKDQKKIDNWKARKKIEQEGKNRRGNIKYFDRRIAETEKRRITLQDIHDALDGLTDSNALSMYFEAAIMNSDPIIAGLSKQLFASRRDAKNNFLSKKLPKLQKMAEKLTSIQGAYGQDLRKYYTDFYEEVEIYQVKDGSLDKLNKFYTILESKGDNLHLVKSVSVNLNNNVSIEFYNELAKLDFRIRSAKQDIIRGTDSEIVKVLEKEKLDFINTHSHRYYIDSFYDTFEDIPANLQSRFDEIDSEIKLREKEFHDIPTGDAFRLLLESKSAKSRLRNEGLDKGQLTEDALTYREYLDRLKNIFTNKEPTSDEILEAERRLSKFRSQYEKDITTDIRRGKIKVHPSHTPAEVKATLMRAFDLKHRTGSTSNEFQKIRSEIYERISKAKELLDKKTGKVAAQTLTELREELQDKISKFKDEERTNLGILYTLEESKEILELEKQIQTIKKESTGDIMSEKERNTFLDLSLSFHTGTPLTKEEKDEMFRLQDLQDEQVKINTDEEITDLKYELKNAYKELFSIQNRVTTSYYNYKVKDLKDQYRNSLIRSNPTMKEEDVETFVKKQFESSEWFKLNHYESITFIANAAGEKRPVKINQPIGIWMKTEPTNPKFIIRRPSNNFFRNKVNEAFINKERIIDPFDNFKDVPKKTSKYDKTSNAYTPLTPNEKPYPKSKEQIDLLEEMIAMYAEEQQSLPPDRRPGYSLPLEEKDLTDRLTEERGLKKTAQSIVQGIKRKFLKNEDDVTEGIGVSLAAIDEEGINTDKKTGLYDKTPLKMRVKSKNSEDMNVSYDVIALLSKFTLRNMLRAQLDNLLPAAKLLLEALDSENASNVILLDNKRTKLRTPNSIKSSQTVRFEHVQEIIKTQFFGELDKESNITILDKELSLNKLVSNLNGWVALSTLGFYIPGGIVNVLSAEVQKIIESSFGTILDFKQYGRGHMLFAKYSKDLIRDGLAISEERSPITNMMLSWNAVQGEFESTVGGDFGKTRLKAFLKSFGHAMAPREFGELEVQSSMWLGKMDSITVIMRDNESKTEEELSLLNAYLKLYNDEDSNGEIKRTLSLKDYDGKYTLFHTTLNEGKFTKDTEFTNQDEVDLQLNIFQTNVRLNGNYEKLNKTIAEKYFLFKAMFLFRRFFIPMSVNRLGGFNKERYNIGAQDWDRGFYITFGKFITDMVRTGFKKGVLIDYWNDPKSKHAIGRTFTENMVIVVLGFLTRLYGYDDDPDDLSWGNLHSLWLMRKLRAETQTFGVMGGYAEMKRITTNPITGMYQIDNALSTLEGLMNYVIGSEDAFYSKDTTLFKKGDAKFRRPLMKLVPGWKAFNYSVYPEYMLEAYKKGESLRNR